jgi:STE24 endopeptidase
MTSRLPRLLATIAALACLDAMAAPLTVPAATPAALALGNELALYWIAAKLLALAIPLLLLISGWGAALSACCLRLARGRSTLSLALFAAAIAVLIALFNLPLDYARHYALPHRLGWSHASLVAWFVEQFVQAMVLVIVAAAFAWIPYAFLRRSPRRWWAWSTVALTPIVLFALVVKPIWVDPLTTSYRPLRDASLASEIAGIAARCGVRDIPIVVGGNDTSVVGLGPTNRIVLQDDLTKSESAAQIRFTIGHELKHYVMGDNWKALAIICALLLCGFWATHRFGSLAISRWHVRFGFDRLSDPASLPLLVFCFTFLWLLATPAFLAFSRHIELEADQFGLEATHENDAAASMFASWITPSDTLADPGWFEKTFMSNHPSIGDRLRNAQTYHPWADGTLAKFEGECVAPGDTPKAR